MKRMTWLGGGALCVVSTVWGVPAMAQTQPVSLFTWQINAGGSITTGTTAKYLHDGWIVGAGMRITPQPTSPFSMLAELNYSYYGATNHAIDIIQSQFPSVRTDSGHGDFFGINFNGVYNLGRHFYLTGGIGWDHRYVALTQTVLVAGTYCDPWWYYCYNGLAPGEQTVADRSTTKFAWNVGGGFEWPIGPSTFVYLDARYRVIETTRKPTEYIPIQIGIRF